MHIIVVHIQVKPEFVEAFRAATLENARNSIQEEGILRFDVLQQADDPTRFMLYEVYRSTDDPPKHRETAHYKTWRATVDKMMAADRTRLEWVNLFPDDSGW